MIDILAFLTDPAYSGCPSVHYFDSNNQDPNDEAGYDPGYNTRDNGNAGVKPEGVDTTAAVPSRRKSVETSIIKRKLPKTRNMYPRISNLRRSENYKPSVPEDDSDKVGCVGCVPRKSSKKKESTSLTDRSN